MTNKGAYLNIVKMTPTKSKVMRGRSIQGMHKAGAIRWDKQASWYPDVEAELMTISDSGPRGKHDDTFDALAYIGLTIDQYYNAESDEELEEAEDAELWDDFHDQGRNGTTGY